MQLRPRCAHSYPPRAAANLRHREAMPAYSDKPTGARYRRGLDHGLRPIAVCLERFASLSCHSGFGPRQSGGRMSASARPRPKADRRKSTHCDDPGAEEMYLLPAAVRA